MRLIETLKGKILDTPPIWFMRQAGRYLPEYRKLRATTSNFLEFCYHPDKASEATLQPLKRFDLDAAIIFSDILVVPDALGCQVAFKKNEGPVLEVVEKLSDLSWNQEHLSPVYDAIEKTRENLAPEKTLIGFAGAPWTLACYMIEGKTSKDFQQVRLWSYQHEEEFLALIDLLASSISAHLIAQIKAGADVVKIFDSWAGVLTQDQFVAYSLSPVKKIIAAVRREYPEVPIILFPRGAGQKYQYLNEIKDPYLGIAFDQFSDVQWMSEAMNHPIQGNLDPIMLATNIEKTLDNAASLMECCKARPFIFNLGHGMLPFTPIEHVERLVSFVKEGKR